MSELIRCNDRRCNLPVAEVTDDGRVIVKAHHHGEKHQVEFRVREAVPPVKKGQ